MASLSWGIKCNNDLYTDVSEGPQMRAITEAEARKWCSGKSVGLRVGRLNFLSYKHSNHFFFITASEEHRAITALEKHRKGTNETKGGQIPPVKQGLTGR